MAYTTTGQLPKNTQDLPTHAAHIYMNAANKALADGHDDATAAKIAWVAVNKAYKKDPKTGKYIQSHKVQNSFETQLPGQTPLECGKKYWKEVIATGTYADKDDPEKTFTVTPDGIKEWVNNFVNKAVEIVTIPLRHTDEPDKNTGVVEALESRDNADGGKSLWALLDIRKDEIAAEVGKTILGVSLRSWDNFIDETGKAWGNVIDHICLTNVPYMQRTAGFIEAEGKGAIKIYSYKIQLDKEPIDINEKEDSKKMELEAKLKEMEVKSKEMEAKMQQLEKEKAALLPFKAQTEKLEDEKIVTQLESQGKIVPAIKVEFEELLTMGRGSKVEFEKDGKKQEVTFREILVAMFEKMPKFVDFETHGKGDDQKPPAKDLTLEKINKTVDEIVNMGGKK